MFDESMNAFKVLSLALIVLGVAGLSAAGGGAH
jgi:multidrug transporter EmrE-like cation transporter